MISPSDLQIVLLSESNWFSREISLIVGEMSLGEHSSASRSHRRCGGKRGKEKWKKKWRNANAVRGKGGNIYMVNAKMLMQSLRWRTNSCLPEPRIARPPYCRRANSPEVMRFPLKPRTGGRADGRTCMCSSGSLKMRAVSSREKSKCFIDRQVGQEELMYIYAAARRVS